MFGDAAVNNVNNLVQRDIAEHLRGQIAGCVALNFIDEPCRFEASETRVYHVCGDASMEDDVLCGTGTFAAVEAFCDNEK